jgi:chromosome partitioning protein
MKVALVNLKGGVAKTTSSIYIAAALARNGSVVLLDGDPQGSASDWTGLVEDSGEPMPFTVKVVNQRTMKKAAQGFDYSVIDTPPGNPQVIDAAIATADIVVIPTDASAMDIQRVWPSIEAAARAGKPAAVLIVRARLNTRSLAIAVETFEQAGAAVIDAYIPLREDIKNAYGTIPTNLHGYDRVATDLLEVYRGIAS